MSPIIIKQPYQIDYIHSYGQDSPWFAALANGKLLASRCSACGKAWPTPRGACTECGGETDWLELPLEGKVHTFTVCHFGAEAFLDQTPFVLAMIEFPQTQTLLLTRLMGVDPHEATLNWVGMKVHAKFRRNSQFNPTDVYFVPA
ncbi:MAG: Zn-ribbon domain-containing OB-fold protein [Pseudomonadota bacterium]